MPQAAGVALLVLGGRFLAPAELGSFVLAFAGIELLRQLVRAGWREAIVMGLAGTILGSLLGIVAARYLSAAMSTLYRTKLPAVELEWTPFLIAAACGLGVSLLAATLPANRASRLSPLEAMRDVMPEEIEGTSWSIVGFGLLIMIVGGVVVSTSILGWLSMFNVVWGALLLFIGMALQLPIALRPLSSAIATLLRPVAGIEARLARFQLLRHRSRTTRFARPPPAAR